MHDFRMKAPVNSLPVGGGEPCGWSPVKSTCVRPYQPEHKVVRSVGSSPPYTVLHFGGINPRLRLRDNLRSLTVGFPQLFLRFASRGADFAPGLTINVYLNFHKRLQTVGCTRLDSNTNQAVSMFRFRCCSSLTSFPSLPRKNLIFLT